MSFAWRQYFSNSSSVVCNHLESVVSQKCNVFGQFYVLFYLLCVMMDFHCKKFILLWNDSLSTHTVHSIIVATFYMFYRIYRKWKVLFRFAVFYVVEQEDFVTLSVYLGASQPLSCICNKLFLHSCECVHSLLPCMKFVISRWFLHEKYNPKHRIQICLTYGVANCTGKKTVNIQLDICFQANKQS